MKVGRNRINLNIVEVKNKSESEIIKMVCVCVCESERGMRVKSPLTFKNAFMLILKKDQILKRKQA